MLVRVFCFGHRVGRGKFVVGWILVGGGWWLVAGW